MMLAAWIGHTDRSRAHAQIVREAIKACGWKDEYAAALMRLTPAQLSRQLAGAEPLNLWRLAELPDEFQREYDARRAGQRGGVVLEAQMVSLIRGFCAADQRQMVKMTTPIEASERKRA